MMNNLVHIVEGGEKEEENEERRMKMRRWKQKVIT